MNYKTKVGFLSHAPFSLCLAEIKGFQLPHLPLNWSFYLLPFVLLVTSDFCLEVGMDLNMPDLWPHIRQFAPVSAAHSQCFLGPQHLQLARLASATAALAACG